MVHLVIMGIDENIESMHILPILLFSNFSENQSRFCGVNANEWLLKSFILLLLIEMAAIENRR